MHRQGATQRGHSAQNVPGWLCKRTLLAANKVDAAGALENAQKNFRVTCTGERFALTRVSAETGEGLDVLRHAVFDMLEVIRVYTKAPGKKLELVAPYVLRRGSHLIDLAAQVHQDFLVQLKYARLWREGRFDGQMMNRDHLLEDKDVVEPCTVE